MLELLLYYVNVNVSGEPACWWTTDALYTGEICVRFGTKPGCGTAQYVTTRSKGTQVEAPEKMWKL